MNNKIPDPIVRGVMLAALAAVQNKTQETIPNGRHDVEALGYYARVYGVSPQKTNVTIQFVIDGIGYTSNLTKTGRIGKIGNFNP